MKRNRKYYKVHGNHYERPMYMIMQTRGSAFGVDGETHHRFRAIWKYTGDSEDMKTSHTYIREDAWNPAGWQSCVPTRYKGTSNKWIKRGEWVFDVDWCPQLIENLAEEEFERQMEDYGL